MGLSFFGGARRDDALARRRAPQRHGSRMLITLPVKDSDVVLGKYLGALGLVLVLVVSTLAYPIVMFKWPWNLGPLDAGPVESGYFGLVLFSAASVAVGLLISALTEEPGGGVLHHLLRAGRALAVR